MRFILSYIGNIVVLIILWGIIFGIKFKKLQQLSIEISDKAVNNKLKVLGKFIVKNPFFVWTLLSFVYTCCIYNFRLKILYTNLANLAFIYLIPTAIFIAIMHFRSNSKNGKKYHIRGSYISDEKTLSNILKTQLGVNPIQISDLISIPHRYETTHFFLIGRPGCGKSQLLYRVGQKVIERNEKAIFYDFKGDQVAKFYDSSKDVLFNPFDLRCAGWNIFNEIETPLDIRSIASSLISGHDHHDPYWQNASRDVFAGILTALYQTENRTNSAVSQCCNLSVQDLYKFLLKYSGTESATQHLEQEKTAASIKSYMVTFTQCFNYLKDINGDFSIKKWASDDADKRRVFLSNYSEISDTIKPILSLFIELSGKRVLSLPESQTRRIFFFIDEFGTLNSLPTIPIMLTNGRSKGMSIWLAIQDVGRIENLYGKELAQTVISACATSFIFGTNEPYTAEYLSRKIGEREIQQCVVSQTSSSWLDFKSSGPTTTTSYHTTNEKTVLPSEILNLPDYVCVAKFPNCQPAPIALQFRAFEDLHQSFLCRDDIKLKSLPKPEQDIALLTSVVKSNLEHQIDNSRIHL